MIGKSARQAPAGLHLVELAKPRTALITLTTVAATAIVEATKNQLHALRPLPIPSRRLRIGRSSAG
ncbi:MAG: hypothetical protein D6709_10795 [Chloroflexi bacterium]|uniref:Uncharacterized protein n=1 Tax=Candidatus Thermofonsia Clade 3 bacterium TaxID=2364212 RepID=A0A2M8QH01_9CHLR|nr:MAG: hypothetical protein CUN48_00320 [Candidatus Thermofonsia Clade 3 bacterium]RMG62745.1 MAG: hypothetical protein D6709_10795 [Chloroflexota bacterium]